MKKLLLLITLAFSLSSCDAQDAANKLNEANAKLDSVQNVLTETRALISNADSLFAVTLMQYDDTVKQMKEQIAELKFMIEACPDSSLIKELQIQQHALEVQIANMRIEISDSYILMQKFSELSKDWINAYEEKYLLNGEEP